MSVEHACSSLFSSGGIQWAKWYYQLRDYLEACGRKVPQILARKVRV